MNDLVKRLRESAKPPLGWVIHTEAADRIERLEAILQRGVELCERGHGQEWAIEARAALQDDKP